MPKKSRKYQGWTNKATWNCWIWLSNDEATVARLQRACEDDCLSYVDFVEAFNVIFPVGMTPDGHETKDADMKELFEATSALVVPDYDDSDEGGE